MKTLLLPLFCLLFCGRLIAQNIEHSLSFGFINEPQLLRPLAGNSWLVAGRGQLIPGGFSNLDSMFALVISASGEIVREIKLELPFSEVHRLEDAVGLPDGSVVFCISLEGCDYNHNNIAVQRYDSTGNLVWSRQSFIDIPGRYPNNLEICPDGNLIGTTSYTIMKLNAYSGNLIWEAQTLDPYTMEPPDIRIFHLLPNSENLIGFNWLGEMQIWMQFSTPNTPEYLMAKVGQPLGLQKIIHDSLTQKFYSFNSHGVYSITYTGKTTLLGTINDQIVDLDYYGNFLCLLVKSGQKKYLFRANTSFSTIDTFETYDRWVETNFIGAINETQFIVTGVEGSGPETGIAPWLKYHAQNLWVRVKGSDTGTPKMDNVALSSVEQWAPVWYQQYYFPPVKENRFNLSGGQFKVLAINTGERPINQLDVLIGFEWNEDGICHSRPVHKKRFSNLNLDIGETIWLDFGDISVAHQPLVPTEFCFWVSAPNGHPDADHEDDVACHTIYLSDEEPAGVDVEFAPNPASDGIWITLPEYHQTGGYIFDVAGKPMQQLEIPGGQTRFFWDTSSLKNGVYIFKIDRWYGKFVVQHP